MKQWNKALQTVKKSVYFRIGAMMLALYLVSGILEPNYFRYDHIMKLLVLCCFLGIICIGQTFVILSGGADLSVAYTVTFTACVFAQTAKFSGSGLAGLLAALLAGVLIGLFKGFGVAVLRITPMVMTLATSAVLMSSAYLYTGGVLKGESIPLVTTLAKGGILSVRYCVLLWLALGLLAIWMLNHTQFGRSVYAVGSNLRVARLSGIHTRATLFGVYVFGSLMMTVVGILLVGYLGYPNYTMGDGYQLISIAAVVIGGTSILGGKGGYLGTIGGVIIIYLIESILIILNIAEAGKEIVNGAIILIILFAYGRDRKLNL